MRQGPRGPAAPGVTPIIAEGPGISRRTQGGAGKGSQDGGEGFQGSSSLASWEGSVWGTYPRIQLWWWTPPVWLSRLTAGLGTGRNEIPVISIQQEMCTSLMETDKNSRAQKEGIASLRASTPHSALPEASCQLWATPSWRSSGIPGKAVDSLRGGARFI